MSSDDEKYNVTEVNFLINLAIDDFESSKTLIKDKRYRNAVSLSYFSMYSMARALLLKKGYTPKSHKGLISLFGQIYVKKEGFDSKIASKFSSSQNSREHASYATSEDKFTLKDAEEAIEVAKSFLKESERFL